MCTVSLVSCSYRDGSSTISRTDGTFLADTEEERVRQDTFNFDRLFRRGFHSVMVIEETAGTVKNILSLGEVPTTFTKFTFDQIDLSGVRWEVRSNRTDWTILMVPGLLNRLNGQEGRIEGSGIGLREVTKFGKSQLGLSWYFRETPVWAVDLETNFTNYGIKAGSGCHAERRVAEKLAFTFRRDHNSFQSLPNCGGCNFSSGGISRRSKIRRFAFGRR